LSRAGCFARHEVRVAERAGQQRGALVPDEEVNGQVARVPPAALDQVAAGRLWDISSELTGVSYDRLPWPA
jgi:hypothetical protein